MARPGVGETLSSLNPRSSKHVIRQSVWCAVLSVLALLGPGGATAEGRDDRLTIRWEKNFLRIRIDSTGQITIYPIGIRRVPRRWKRRSTATGPELVPDDSRATQPELIEAPIVLK